MERMRNLARLWGLEGKTKYQDREKGEKSATTRKGRGKIKF